MIKVKLPPNDDVFTEKNSHNWGETEFNIAKSEIENFRTCLDIGAHIGLTTIRYAKHFKRVYSFEPIWYDLLVENTCHLANVVTKKKAVSDFVGEIDIYPGTHNSGVGIIPNEYNTEFINKRFKNKKSRYYDVKAVKVETVAIDILKLVDVDFIKIDVEGYNIPIFEGLKQTIIKSYPVIQLEMAYEKNVNTITDNLLFGLGYEIFNKFERDQFYRKKK